MPQEKQAKSGTRRGFTPTGERKKRGKYKKYDNVIKAEVIRRVLECRDISQVSKEMGIPRKNIKRWVNFGVERKKGGRKMQDPKMEAKLAAWVISYIKEHKEMPKSHLIRSKSLEYSTNPEFKASKGWMEKFKLRNNFQQYLPQKIEDDNHQGTYLLSMDDSLADRVKAEARSIEASPNDKGMDDHGYYLDEN